MKRIFQLSLLALALNFTACEDAFNIVQESELGEEAAFRNVDDLQTGLNGAYAAYNPDAASNGVGDSFLFSDLFTDNMKRSLISNSGQGSEVYSFILNSNSNAPGSIWSSRYSAINRINRVIRNFDRVLASASASDVQRADGIMSQLLALRALCHFDLFQYFTPDYENTSSPSAIIMNFVPDVTQTFPRNSAGEMLEFILSDIDEAAALTNTSFTDKFYLTSDAIKFLKAKVLLIRNNPADYGIIESIADDLFTRHNIITIFADDTDPASAITPERFVSFWADDTDATMTEEIFSLFRGQNDNGVAGMFYANTTDEDGSPFFEMSTQLFNLYANDDIRIQLGVWLDETSNPSATPPVLLINKYPGSAPGQLINNIKLFRASELLLIKAEVQARQNNFAGAAASIQKLRTARLLSGATVPPIYTSVPQVLADILLERRKELCYEGHRYLDLKRIGGELNLTMSRATIDCGSFTAPCDLSTSDYRFTLPIPRVEIDANPSIQQNPNY